MQAICHLDIGYVLFGEDYKRGRLLVEMQREQKEAGIICTPELPDHLPYVLQLLAVHEDKERACEMAHVLVLPALEKMLQNFKKDGNVYRHVLTAAAHLLEKDYGKTEILPSYQPQLYRAEEAEL